MSKRVPRRVNTLSGFLRWAEQFNDGQYLFRGLPNKTHNIEASACRRLLDADRNNPKKLLKINQELIEKSRLLGHDQLRGHRLSDLPLLAELQHFRAATCLIDFTRNAFIALWFASEETFTKKDLYGSKEKNDGVINEVDGKVFAVRIDDPERYRTVTSDLLEENIDYFFKEDGNGRYPLYQWQPKRQNNRIIAQQSIFIFGGAKIEVEDECVVVGANKKNILKALDKISGITDATIYPDSDGFARLHVHNNPDFEPDPKGYLQRGIELHEKNELEDAISCYTTVISPPVGYFLQPSDNEILFWAYYHRGIAHFHDDPSESTVNLAIDDFTEAIQLKRSAINLATEDSFRMTRHKKDLARTYVHHGIAHYRKDDFDSAIIDFSEAIKLDSSHADAYNQRGTIYLYIGEIDLAISDYTKAIELDPELVDTYIELGIVYFGKGDFDRALEAYNEAIQRNPEDTNTYIYRGLTYFSKGEYNNAIDDFSKGIHLKPENVNAYYHRSTVWLSLQNWEKAKEDLTSAKSNGLDVMNQFQENYGSIKDFEQKTDVKLPKDIITILTQQ